MIGVNNIYNEFIYYIVRLFLLYFHQTYKRQNYETTIIVVLYARKVTVVKHTENK